MTNLPDALSDTEIGPLSGLVMTELRSRWKDLFGRPAPRSFKRKLLIRGISYQTQVRATGDLSPATKRRLREIAHAIRTGQDDAVIGTPILTIGSQLIRRWRGTSHIVAVVDGGFTCEGRMYRSLSAVAKAITGTNWNGRKFFGIKPAFSPNKNAAGRRGSTSERSLPQRQRRANQQQIAGRDD